MLHRLASIPQEPGWKPLKLVSPKLDQILRSSTRSHSEWSRLFTEYAHANYLQLTELAVLDVHPDLTFWCR